MKYFILSIIITISAGAAQASNDYQDFSECKELTIMKDIYVNKTFRNISKKLMADESDAYTKIVDLESRLDSRSLTRKTRSDLNQKLKVLKKEYQQVEKLQTEYDQSIEQLAAMTCKALGYTE